MLSQEPEKNRCFCINKNVIFKTLTSFNNAEEKLRRNAKIFKKRVLNGYDGLVADVDNVLAYGAHRRKVGLRWRAVPRRYKRHFKGLGVAFLPAKGSEGASRRVTSRPKNDM